jgi:hypothetical protein
MSIDNLSDWIGRPVRVSESGGARIYLKQGKRYPSVTTVIGRVFPGLFDGISGKVMEHARSRGQEVHRAMALLAGVQPNVTLDWDSLDVEVRPRVAKLQRWLDDNRWRPFHVERSFFSDLYGTAGTVDQTGYLGDETALTVLDFKPELAPMARIQLAGYALCVEESLGLEYVPNRVSLHHSAKAEVRDTRYTKHFKDKADFLNILGAHHVGSAEGWWK